MNLGFRRAIFLISSVAIVVVLWCVYLGGDPVGIERLMPSSSSVLNLVAVGVVSLFLFSAIVALAGYKLIHFSNPKVIPAPYFSLCGATVIAVVYTDYSWDLAWIFIGYVAIGISSLVIVEVYNSEFWFRRSSGDVRVVERPIHDPEEDTFGYAGRARVLARRILAKQDPLLIVGSYGAGKTSLANLIYFLLDGNGKEELDGKRLRKRGKWNRPKGPGWHLVKVKGWGKGSPESRARAIVSEILDEMLVWVDVVMVREYFTGYIEELFGQKGNVYSGLFKARRPDYNHLAWYLGEVLALTDSHILVVLDDFERNAEVGPMGARWHDGVSEVIDSLREIHRLHIVVCVDSAALRGLDQYRLFCSHEILPNLNADVVEGRILSLYQKLIDKAVSANVLWAEGDSPDIPNGSDRHFHLEESGKSYLWNTSVSNVLCTPRIVCFYERAVERSWSVLQGEVDLIDIMVFEAIKCRLPRSSIEVFWLDVSGSRVEGVP